MAMVVGAVAADAIGFINSFEEVRWTNVAFVWLLPHQLGSFYAALLLLTNPIFGEAGERWFPGIGHYPKRLLGTDVEPITNTYPPTVPTMAMAFWSIGLAMLLRPRLSRWLQRARPWKAVILTNSVIMTLFLWHMTAYLLAILLLWPLGFGQQGSLTLGWWGERPLWVRVSAVFLTGLIAVFGRFERPR